MLTFDADKHEYRYGGVIVPSVTQTIHQLYEGAFEKIPPAVLERKTEIGKAVHLACELYDQGDLDESSLDDVVRGYFEGWKRFMAENKCAWTGIEKRVFHPVHRYSGTLDRKGTVNGAFSYIDIKTVATVSKITGVQLAGYEEADRESLSFAEKMVKAKRIAIQLKPNGTYERHEFSSTNDWPIFVACLTVNRFTGGKQSL